MATRKNILKACFVAALSVGLAACGSSTTEVVNTPPSLVLGGNAAINEGMTGRTGLTVTATDGQGDAITYDVSDARFDVVGGMLVVVAGAILDYEDEMERSIAVDITANDGELSDTETVNVMVRDVNDNAPTLEVTGPAVVERDEGTVSVNTPTHKVEVMDADDHETPTAMVSDDRFYIDEHGYLTIKAGKSFNYEEEADRSIRLEITASDGTNTADPHTIIFNIADVNDNAPTLEVTTPDGPALVMRDEGTMSMTRTAYKVEVMDADTHMTPPPIPSDDRFYIDEQGYLTIRAGSSFDYEDEADRSIELTITANDGRNAEASHTITFNIADVNDNAPTLEVTGPAVVARDEGTVSVNTRTHEVEVMDADTHMTPQPMVSGDPGDRFYIDEQGYLTIKANSSFNYEVEADRSIELTITATDGTYTADRTITFNIADVDEPPMITGNQEPELVMGPYGDGGHVTTLTAVDPEGEPVLWRIASGDPQGNPDEDVWIWRSTDRNEYKDYTLSLEDNTFLGSGEAMVGRPGYSGYTADDVGNLMRHLVVADDADLDERARVVVEKTVDRVKTSPALAMYETYGTGFIPSFDHLTGPVVSFSSDRSGETVSKRLLTSTETTDLDAIADPKMMVPTEPAGLDIVTDTRSVDITSDLISKGKKLAIRYRWSGLSVGRLHAYNRDVALVGDLEDDGERPILEEYRDADAYTDVDVSDNANLPTELQSLQSDLRSDMHSIQVSLASADADDMHYARYGLWAYNNNRGCSTCPVEGLRGATVFGLKARPGDLDVQDHVGVWDGHTVAIWGSTDSDDIETLRSGSGTAKIAVNFNNNKVQANMELTGNHRFGFVGRLHDDRLGYTAEIDTTVPGGGKGMIEPLGGSAGLELAADSDGNIHAVGSLEGGFYGPPTRQGSTVKNAMASAETAGTWEITDVPDISLSPNDPRTIVIGSFGADLTANTRLGDEVNLNGITTIGDD